MTSQISEALTAQRAPASSRVAANQADLAKRADEIRRERDDGKLSKFLAFSRLQQMNQDRPEDNPDSLPGDPAAMNSAPAANSDGFDTPSAAATAAHAAAAVANITRREAGKSSEKTSLDMLNDIFGQVDAKQTLAAHMVAIKNDGKTAGIPRNIIFSGPQGGQHEAALAMTKFYAEAGVVGKYELTTVDAFRLSTAPNGVLAAQMAITDAKGGVLLVENAHMLQAGIGEGGKALREILNYIENEKTFTTDKADKGKPAIFLSGWPLGLADQQHIPIGLPGLNIVTSTEISRYCGVEAKFTGFSKKEAEAEMRKQLKSSGYTAADQDIKDAAALAASGSVAGMANQEAVERVLANAIAHKSKSGIATQNGELKLAPSIFQVRQDKQLSRANLMGFVDRADEIEKTWAQLNALTGLEDEKALIRQMIGRVEIANARRAAGLEVKEVRKHIAIGGPSGKGKTTLATLGIKLLGLTGALPTTYHEIVPGSALIGTVVGATAPKTDSYFQRCAMGGLVIDEASGIIAGANKEHFGAECVKAMIYRLELNKATSSVWFLDYPDKLEALLDMDAGFRRRLGEIFIQKDYSNDELMKIFESMVAKDQYVVDDAGRARVLEYLQLVRQLKGFGNAGTVEKIIDNATQKQTDRLLKMTGEPVKGSHDTSRLSRDDLMKLLPEELVTDKMMEDARKGVDSLKDVPLVMSVEPKSQFPYGVGGTQNR